MSTRIDSRAVSPLAQPKTPATDPLVSAAPAESPARNALRQDGFAPGAPEHARQETLGGGQAGTNVTLPRGDLGFTETAPGASEVKGSVTPNQPFSKGQPVTSTLHLDGSVNLQSLSLTLDLAHRDVKGLHVTLTSPSGKQYEVPVAPAHATQATFDLSSAFANEPAQGDWTLTVGSDHLRDKGTVNAWSLDGTGVAPNPDPKPIPARKDGPVDPALPNRPRGPQHGPIIHYEWWVTTGLARGDQPTLKDLERMKADGIKSIVNLRIENNDDEAMCKQLGLNYLQIPIVDKTVPTQAQMKQFLDFATDPANGPVFVHCLAGHNRTGIAVACYEMAVEGMTADQAIAEGETFGLHQADQEAFIRQFGADLAAGKIPGYPLQAPAPAPATAA